MRLLVLTLILIIVLQYADRKYMGWDSAHAAIEGLRYLIADDDRCVETNDLICIN